MRHTIGEIRAEYNRLDSICKIDTSKIPIKISKRMVSSYGFCYYKRGEGNILIPKEIRIADFIMTCNYEFWDVIRHEYAHAAAAIRSQSEKSHGHDEVWKEICSEIGCRPDQVSYDWEVHKKAYRRRKAKLKYEVKCLDCGRKWSYVRAGAVVRSLQSGDSNSSHLPVSYTEDVFEALDIQDELQTLYTSGTVFHAFLGEKLPTWEAAANLVRKIAENYRLPYYTMSPTYSVCRTHGYLTGEHFTCPHCGQNTEVYSRITGYYRPVQNWNDGKAQEYKERREYDIGKSHMKNRRKDAPEKKEMASSDSGELKEQDAPQNLPLLFATATCPNCRMACHYLDKAGVIYKKILAEENAELVSAYGIKQAPTMVMPDGTLFFGAGAIKAFADTMK